MADALYSAPLYSEALYADGVPVTIAIETVEYLLEVRTAAGVRQTYLPYWHDGKWTQQLNAPDLLTFSYPAQDDACVYFARPYEVWLWDMVAEEILQKFRIVLRDTVGISAPEEVRVECESLLGQLREEVVPEYQQTAAQAKTLRQALNGYFALQNKSPKIYVGTIDGGLALSQENVWTTNTNILAAIERLHEKVGGYYYVTPYRRLNWQQSPGQNKGQQFRRGKNLQGISAKVDYRNQCTRLYAYGHGSDRETRLNLIDAGEPVEYIANAGAEATYGVVADIWVDPEIENAAELKAKCLYILSQRKDPEVNYAVNVVDLAKDKNAARDFEHVELGAQILVIDEVLGINTKQYVVKITRDLDKMLILGVELATYRKSVADIIAKLARKIDEEERTDAGSDLTEETLDEWDVVTETNTDWVDLTDGGNADAQHVHTTSDLSNDNALALGTAAPGIGTEVSRDDHVHPIPVYS